MGGELVIIVNIPPDWGAEDDTDVEGLAAAEVGAAEGEAIGATEDGGAEAGAAEVGATTVVFGAGVAEGVCPGDEQEARTKQSVSITPTKR